MAALQIVWFKRDLRTLDHRPLAAAAERGLVLPLYVVEYELWQQPDASERQWLFCQESLVELRQALADLGQPLVCLLYTSPSPRDGLLSRMPSSA